MPAPHVLSGPLDGGDDLRAGRGAPNLDGHVPHTPLARLRRIPDGARLEP
jgi:hypothetical protein